MHAIRIHKATKMQGNDAWLTAFERNQIWNSYFVSRWKQAQSFELTRGRIERYRISISVNNCRSIEHTILIFEGLVGLSVIVNRTPCRFENVQG